MKIKKYQMGGEMPAQPTEATMAAPAEQSAQDPIMQIASMMAHALQTGDCNIAMQACEAFLMLLQQASAPAPMEAAPQGQPVFKKGGKIVSRR